METKDTIVLISIATVLYLFFYLKKCYEFFDRYNIPYTKPNWIFGNMTGAVFMKKRVFMAYADLYRQLDGYKFAGFFTMQKPSVLIRDPELIKDVLIKEFGSFQDRGITVNEEVEPITNHLFSIRGEEWKTLRTKLSGAFSSGKIKTMFPRMKKLGEKLQTVLLDVANGRDFDAEDLCERFTTDVIGSCIFGIDINSLDHPESEFRLIGKRVASFRWQRAIRSLWPGIPNRLIKLFKITLFEEQCQTFFTKMVEDTTKYLQQNGVSRSDFFDLLMSLKNTSSSSSSVNEKSQKKLDITIDMMAAQYFFFFTTGSRSPATAISCALFELARHENTQNKMREEIRTVLKENDDQLTYDVLNKMTYVDMVIAETFRKYPTMGMLLRRCKQNYRVPDTDAIISNNTPAIISIVGLHNDEKYFEKPNDFYPEHFTEVAKSKRPQHAYLPFGEGPRACIAKHFAKLEVKIGLIFMVRNYSYKVSLKQKLPFKLQSNFGFAVENGVWLKCEKVPVIKNKNTSMV
ncbi:probable cytochrome P450 6a13 [Planococcus citri]|uniref:probable cytochrome P450 6a13 n=1 Tax=Planococcus citri TaxID=170843 RepID=UPI0031F7CE35